MKRDVILRKELPVTPKAAYYILWVREASLNFFISHSVNLKKNRICDYLFTVLLYC